MAVHPKEELLVHILDPSRSVEGNFRVYTRRHRRRHACSTACSPSESKTAVELIDAEGKKHTILREDIDELTGSTKSLMPEGFEKQVKPQGADRPAGVPDPEGQVPAAAAGQGRDGGQHARACSTARTPSGERLVFADWKPKTFEGVPFVLVDPQGDKVPNVDPAVRPARASCRRRCRSR